MGMHRRHTAGSLHVALLLGVMACTEGAADAPAAPQVLPGGCAPGEIAEGESCLAPGISVCPDGFDTIDGGCTAALPTTACPNGTMAVPGDAFCSEPTPCGSGRWGDIPLEPNTHHVDASHAGTSDGSVDRPWRTVQAAIDAVPPAGMIAVAEGVYDESLVIGGKAVRIWGKCPTLTAVGRPGQTAILVEAQAHGTEIHGLSISGAFGVANGGSRDVLLEGVWIHDTTSRGVLSEGQLGEASTIVRRSLIDRASEIGASAFGGTLTIDGSVIRNTQLGSGSGRGISVRGGSVLTVVNSVIENNLDLGILVSGSVAHIERTLVRDTMPVDGLGGGGVTLQPDSTTLVPASGTLDGVVIERNHTYGLLVDGSTASLSRVSVRDIAAQPSDGSVGAAVQIQAHDVTGTPADVTIRELLCERSHYAGLSITGAHVDASRVLVRDLYPEPRTGQFGRGILTFFDPSTQQGVTGTFRGVRIERAVEAGFFGQGVDLTLSDLAVMQTYARPDGDIGRGVCFQSESADLGSVAVLERVWIDQNHDAGLLLEGTTATVDHIFIADTLATVAEGKFGDAIQVLSEVGFAPAVANIHNAHVEGSQRAGIAVYGATVSIANSALECNPIDLNGQHIGNNAFALSDAGGNRCGCGEEQKDCRVLTTDLEPPSAL